MRKHKAIRISCLEKCSKSTSRRRKAKKLYKISYNGVKNKNYLIIISFKLNKRCKYILILGQRDKTRNVINKTHVYTIEIVNVKVKKKQDILNAHLICIFIFQSHGLRFIIYTRLLKILKGSIRICLPQFLHLIYLLCTYLASS